MSLGTGAYKVGGAGQCSSTRKEVSMATLRATPTRHPHTELFSGILTDQILNWPETKMGGRAGKKHCTKMATKARLQQNTLCKELQASNCKYKP